MEIKDYLKVLGKRAWLLVMIPAVAGVVAGLIAVRQPQAFRTTATLQLPHDANASPAEVAQLVADFRAAANNPTVQSTVSEASSVPVKRIKRLKIAQVGDSSQLTLGLLDKKHIATDSKAVILGVTSGALKYLDAPEVKNGQRAVEAANAKIAKAQADLEKANAQLAALYTSIKSSTPEEDLKILRSESSQLDLKLVQAEAEGQTAAADRYRKAKDELDARIFGLIAAQPQVDALRLQATDATTALTAAQAERETASELLSAATSQPDLVFSAEGQAVVRKTRVVKTAAAAVVAGFPIAIGVVLLLDALQKRRQNRPPKPTRDAHLDDDDEDDDLDIAPVAAAPALIGATARSAPEPEDDVDLDEEAAADTTVLAVADDDAADPTVLTVADDDAEVDELEVDELEDDELEDDELEDLEDEDLADEDLDDDLDDDLDEDVEATVASRRRMYEADIDDDLSVDGGHADRNGKSRVWARVPATDEDFDGDDEGTSADH